MRIQGITLLVVTVMSLSVCVFAAKKPDPLAGRWEMNVKKSRFGSEVKRKQETLVCVPQKNGVACTIQGTLEDGSKEEASYAASYDGAGAAVKGMKDADEVRLERVSDTIASVTLINRGRNAHAYRTTKSDDGKTLTVVSVDPVTRRRVGATIIYDLIPEK